MFRLGGGSSESVSDEHPFSGRRSGVYYGWGLRRFRVQVGGGVPMAERPGARTLALTEGEKANV
jgi:hypothetical protein